MSKTIVGLYDDRGTAEKVVNALKNRVDEDRIHTVWHGEKLSKNTFSRGDDLEDSLSNSGVPEDEAMLYAEGVRRGGNLVVVRAGDDAQHVADIMNTHNPINLQHRSAYWRQKGWQRRDRSQPHYTDQEAETERKSYRQHTARELAETEEQIPIIEEELRVGKRRVEKGGVRVHSSVEERPVEKNVNLHEEHVDVERRTTDRKLSPEEADAAFKDRDIEMRETAEEVVAEKEARQTGEVVVKKTGEDRTETVRDTVRRTEVDVDERPGTTGSRFEDHADIFRNHYQSTFGSSNRPYSEYEPAYRWGYAQGSDKRYSERDWKTAEPELRTSYEKQHGKDSFEQVKSAIRHAYDHARGTRKTRTTSRSTSTR
ncbi:MAG: DUF2382 domain-containing protein [Bacteroidota bacterium]